MKNIKCSKCGKFIKWIDFDEDKVLVGFTPDSCKTKEEIIHTHKKCIKDDYN